MPYPKYNKAVRKRYIKHIIKKVVKSNDSKFLNSDVYAKSKIEKNIEIIEPGKVLGLIQSNPIYLDPMYFRKLVLRIENITDLDRILCYAYNYKFGPDSRKHWQLYSDERNKWLFNRFYPFLENITINENELEAKTAILSEKFLFTAPYLAKSINDPKIAKELLLAGYHYECLVDKIENSQDAKELLISKNFEAANEKNLCSKIGSPEDAFELLMKDKNLRLNSLMVLCRKLESIEQILKIQEKYNHQPKTLNSLLEKKLNHIKNHQLNINTD